jgi:holo-[acyl-carrier protein] synthase
MAHAPAPTRTVVRCAVDLVRVTDVEGAVRDFGDRYLERVFSAHEIAACGGGGTARAASLAARFAAKEAAVKLLREPDLAAPWHDVEVVTDLGGWPTLRLRGPARELAVRRGLHDLDVSMSHDGDYAIAMVTAYETTRVNDDPVMQSNSQHDDT